MRVVYDAGALIAADRGDRGFLSLHDELMRLRVVPVVPAPVVAQVWRRPDRQVSLVRLLRGCRIVDFDRGAAERTGMHAGAVRVSDVVDCCVAEIALRLGAVVMTSNPKDIRAAGVPVRLIATV